MNNESNLPPETSRVSPIVAHERKGLLRFITCGSVDDGKSTLIGRLLYESHVIFDDHLAALAVDSARFGTRGDNLDFALVVDGLAAEREQGITIDVAYRYFSTDRRKFIVADTPGHEQYTRNMVTGATTADLAVILVDARHGVVTQTRRHSHVASLIGIKQVVLAVNKIDLVGYSRDRFDAITADYRDFAADLGFDDVVSIPISAVFGDNVTTSSENTPWYVGPVLVAHLESVVVDTGAHRQPFRFPVQLVNRPHGGFRGFSGTVASGEIRPGDDICALPSGLTSRVARISSADGDLDEAVVGQSVTLVLTHEIDVSRGTLLCSVEHPVDVADQFEADVIWMYEEPMHPGRRYLLKLGPITAGLTISPPKYVLDVNTHEHLAAKTLVLNEIGVCIVMVDRPLPFESYASNRDLGGFIVIDRMTNATVAAGLLRFALRRSTNAHWQELDVTPESRSAMKGHRPGVVWLTGLSGAGKSTIANHLEARLHDLGVHTFLLDGDNIRHGLNRDLGFTETDRVENVRRVGEVAGLMVDAGLIVLVSLISPYREERQGVRDLVGEARFCEVFVDTPIEIAERRDPKGLYAKARRGDLPNFTGIDSPYESPVEPEVRIDTTRVEPGAAAELIVAKLRNMNLVGDSAARF